MPSRSSSDPDHTLRPDGLATSVAILLAVSVVQRFVGFGRGVLFCRWLSPEELGQWEMAYSFMLLAAPIIVLGVPGSMGRYLERYRQRNQLRTFLSRTIAWTCTATVLAVGLLLIALPQISKLVFGTPKETGIVKLMAISLAAIILHHFLEALFAALRLFRLVSAMHFVQSMCFAAISLTLLCTLPVAAENIVFAYGTACAISASLILLWMRKPLALLREPGESVPPGRFWPPLLRFAIWVWVANLLCHLFDVVDRYMIVHFSGMDNATALTEVGNYHSSRIVPLLFVSVAELLSGVIVPYLSHDWETGQRAQVARRLNLFLKLTGLVMLTAGTAVLWVAPWLFRIAFAGKYDSGMAVLPFTLTYCVLYSLLVISMSYLLCAERTRVGTLPIAIGLVSNVCLNLLLLPLWGLPGAVIATTTATGIALLVLCGINHLAGLRYHARTLWLLTAPLVLSLGPVCSTVLAVALWLTTLTRTSWLTKAEREDLGAFLRERLESLGWSIKPSVKTDSAGLSH